MKYYVLTEEQKNALLKDLEFEKFKTPDQFCITEEAKQAQLNSVETMHRRFHCIVARALE